MRRLGLLLALTSMTMTMATSAGAIGAPRDQMMGTWLTEDGLSKIRFERCGNEVCGRIVWLKFPTDPKTGQPPVDKNNPDPGLRKRPIMGLTIFSKIRPASETEWSAAAYNSEDANIYDVTLRMKDDGSLGLEGCGLGGLICQEQTWTRAEN